VVEVIKIASFYVALGGIRILLSPPPKGWDYSHVPPCLLQLVSFYLPNIAIKAELNWGIGE
jgi:hypothetical protein